MSGKGATSVTPPVPKAGREMGHLTMSRIAEELGLSRHTVSTVLNNLDGVRGISKHTASRVRQYVSKRGYIPARHAVRMRRNSAVFGLMVDGAMYSHLHDALIRFSDFAARNPQQMEVVFCQLGGIANGLEELAARRITRLIWLNSESWRWNVEGEARYRSEHARVMALLPQFQRLVVYNFYFPAMPEHREWLAPNVVRVGVDRDWAVADMGRHLTALGHRRVAAMGVSPGDNGGWLTRGLSAVGLEYVGIRPRELPNPIPVPYPEETGDLLAEPIIRAMERDGVTAACFSDDMEAGYALRALIKRGVRIPQDLSVTGFDGQACGALFSPSLTTLSVPVNAMVDAALTALSKEAAGGDVQLPMTLLRRESCGPART